jgi:DNA-binding NtrC family response regulator
MGFLVASDMTEIPTVDTREADPFRHLVGESAAHVQTVQACRKQALMGLRDVLLLGEPGTGKARFARAMHDASPRAGEAFLQLDCSGLSAEALEVELFGRAPGAVVDAPRSKMGLLELAGSGTLFLRRVDLLPPVLQPLLLHAVEHRLARPVGGREAYDVRCAVVTSASPAIQEGVANGRFRADLFEALSASMVKMAPLRERPTDIEGIATHFIAETSRSEGLVPKPVSPEALNKLIQHTWPGNVRELRHTVRTAVLQSAGHAILPSDLRIRGHGRSASTAPAAAGRGWEIKIPPEGRSMEEIEEEAVRLTLEITRWNKSAAARILGISRPTLARKIDKYDLCGRASERG